MDPPPIIIMENKGNTSSMRVMKEAPPPFRKMCKIGPEIAHTQAILIFARTICCAGDNNQLRISQISKHREQPNSTNNHQKKAQTQTYDLTRFGLNAYVLGAIQWKD